MRTLLDDLRFTLRQLRRSPAFVFTAVATLTLAIAANVVVYGIADALILRPLPVPQPQEIVQVQGEGLFNVTISYPNVQDLIRRTRSFDQIAMYRLARMAVGIDGKAQPLWGTVATGNFFSALGMQPELGRFFTPAEDTAVNAHPVVVLSDSCWRVRFHGDPQIIGRSVALNRHPYVVVGVAPTGFHGVERFAWPELWVPFHQGPEIDGYDQWESRGTNSSWVLARMKTGLDRAAADADLRRVSAQLQAEYPKDDAGWTLHTTSPGLVGDTLGKPVRAFVGSVMALALLVLLAACANLGVLFSSRTADRARELGIRLAVGSTRGRIVRQLVMESVTVSLLGGAVAAALATAMLRGLSQWRPTTDLPAHLFVDPDVTSYLVAALLAVVTGLVFGLLPARQVWQTDPNRTMRSAGSTASSERSWLRSTLLVVQIALCCLLVTSSFVALRGLLRSARIPLGFAPEGVTLAVTDLQLAGVAPADRPAMQKRLLESARAIPGVTSAAISDKTPLSASSNSDTIYAPGTTSFDSAHVRTWATRYNVSPGYFYVAGTRLLEGRDFTDHDTAQSTPVAIVSRTFATKVFGTEHAVGLRFPIYAGSFQEVVGVTEDGKVNFLTEEPQAILWRPLLQQNGNNEMVLMVRSSRDPAEMTMALRHAVEGVDSAIPLFSVAAWPDALSLATFPARAATLALGVLGSLAIMLALTGIFGVASFTVARRMRELGIRVALGAQGRQVLRAALAHTGRLLLLGSIAGLALGIAASRLLANIVYQATAADPLVLAAVALTMALLGATAAALPARRALLVHPAILLREE